MKLVIGVGLAVCLLGTCMDSYAQGNTSDKVLQGVQHASKKEYSQAIACFREAVEKGAEAQWRLGLHYIMGWGVEKNDAEAVKWYRKSAEQGNAEGQYLLGYCYAAGLGVEQNNAEAVKWYRKSAEQGNVAAQLRLGICYYSGVGVDQNYTEAAKWYRKSAEQGNAEAQLRLGSVCSIRHDFCGGCRDSAEGGRFCHA